MLAVGLTGGIGSGKTAVSDCFSRYGIPVIDTDHIARELVAPGQPALSEIIRVFGPDCLDHSGCLHRTRLRERVFSDAAGRQRLEAILHPRIRAVVRQRTVTLNTPYYLVVIPLLVETGMTDLVDRVLVVDVTESEQIRRVMIRDQIGENQVRQILAAQASREQRLTLADDILTNNDSFDRLNSQVRDLHRRYMLLAARKHG
ncbi:MAG: dephospho-CoA kinase [Candidatus Contendobacter odensis]|uniref:Dephospho-CoA kinase n=1 Tax=Candidatus Contendibacter odensensis TaxID=1400860 RepID=A0A2G6PFV7_9GAMM|nr:MAG: dephospho-CoA kinase [Candidatus Contendobacter odensis]